MKILLISSFYPPVGVGGAEKAASLLARALVEAGHQVSVISFQPGKEESMDTLDGVRVYRVPLDNLYFPVGRTAKEPPAVRTLWHLIDIWNWRAARRVGRILDREQPDVVHSHVIAGFSVAVWRAVKRRKIRLVHTLHDYYMLCVRSSMFREGHACEQQCGSCKAFTRVRKTASPLVDHLVSVSQHVLGEHRRHGYFEGVPASTIFNVMDANVATPQRRDDGPLTFGFIGKIEEPKGLRVLLEATARLDASADWKLRIAGSGLASYVQELKGSFPDPRIEWLGFAQPAQFFASIDVAIVPSVWNDPLPYVAIEALFAGKSLIAAEAGGIPEIAALGRTVSLFPPGDTAALAACIEAAFADKARWRSGGFRDPLSAERFRADVVVGFYTAVYRSEDRDQTRQMA